MSVYFVTGASRGFGIEIAARALAEGHQVVATARRSADLLERFSSAGDALLAVDLDVTDPEQIDAAVASALARFGRIDVVVNNAGRGLLSAVEEASDDAVRAIYDTNVFGVLNVLRAVLPSMRTQRSGRIINISSVGGFRGFAGWGVYGSTKFALEGLSEALDDELTPLGIRGIVVQPGYVRTDFLDGSSLHVGETIIDDYSSTVGALRRTAVELNHAQPGDPVRAAEAIISIAEADDPPSRLQLGSDSFEVVTDKLNTIAAEQQRWRELAVSTDFPEAAVS
jgi:NAD(P)-dependent dehydrogenase (short-subunit alcohol dehydrogenase family)